MDMPGVFTDIIIMRLYDVFVPQDLNHRLLSRRFCLYNFTNLELELIIILIIQ